MNLLKKYLNSVGVADFSHLSNEEKETYRTWEKSLEGNKLTDDDVAKFLVTEENSVIEKLIGAKLKEKDDVFYKAELSFIRKIKGFLRTPELEKKMTEQNLINLLKN